MIVCEKQQESLAFINNIRLSLADKKDKKAQEIIKSMEELSKDS